MAKQQTAAEKAAAEKATAEQKAQAEKAAAEKATAEQKASSQPKKKKLVKRKVGFNKEEKDTSNFVPGNMDSTFKISPEKSKKCFVYAIRHVQMDDVTGEINQGKWQLISYNYNSVVRNATIKNGEIVVNAHLEGLRRKFKTANVKIVNDPTYEYVEE